MVLITFTKKIDRMLLHDNTNINFWRWFLVSHENARKNCLCLKISMIMIAANLVLPTKGPTLTKYFNVHKRWIFFLWGLFCGGHFENKFEYKVWSKRGSQVYLNTYGWVLSSGVRNVWKLLSATEKGVLCNFFYLSWQVIKLSIIF